MCSPCEYIPKSRSRISEAKPNEKHICQNVCEGIFFDDDIVWIKWFKSTVFRVRNPVLGFGLKQERKPNLPHSSLLSWHLLPISVCCRLCWWSPRGTYLPDALLALCCLLLCQSWWNYERTILQCTGQVSGRMQVTVQCCTVLARVHAAAQCTPSCYSRVFVTPLACDLCGRHLLAQLLLFSKDENESSNHLFIHGLQGDSGNLRVRSLACVTVSCLWHLSMVDVNHAMPWEHAWASSYYNEWSALLASGRKIMVNSVKGEGNCVSRSMVSQIKTLQWSAHAGKSFNGSIRYSCICFERSHWFVSSIHCHWVVAGKCGLLLHKCCSVIDPQVG